ncbi:hypothetical protein JCM10449v2_006872 [Rhodotorula kratochvilovae]
MHTPDALLASLSTQTSLSRSDLLALEALATSLLRFGATADEALAHALWREELQRHAGTLRDRRAAEDLDEAMRSGTEVGVIAKQRAQREAAQCGQAQRSDAVRARGKSASEKIFWVVFWATFVVVLVLFWIRETHIRIDGARNEVRLSSETFFAFNLLLMTAGFLSCGMCWAISASPFVPLPESPTPPQHRPTPVDPTCSTCLDPSRAHLVRLACNHLYCHTCLVQLVRLATRDEAHHPASCCGVPLAASACEGVLPAADREAYAAAVKEFGQPGRLYRANRACGVFLGKWSRDTTSREPIKCEKCGAETCPACRSPAHRDFRELCNAESDALAACKFATLDCGARCKTCGRVV